MEPRLKYVDIIYKRAQWSAETECNSKDAF